MITKSPLPNQVCSQQKLFFNSLSNLEELYYSVQLSLNTEKKKKNKKSSVCLTKRYFVNSQPISWKLTNANVVSNVDINFYGQIFKPRDKSSIDYYYYYYIIFLLSELNCLLELL